MIEKLLMNNMFKDSRDNVIYYDKFSDTAYKVPKNAVSMVKAFQSRGLYSVIVFLLMYENNYDIVVTIVSALALYGATTAYLMFAILPKYNVVNKFNTKEAQKNNIQNKPVQMLITTLYVISIVLIGYLALAEKNTTFIIAGTLYSLYAIFKIIQNVYNIKK